MPRWRRLSASDRPQMPPPMMDTSIRFPVFENKPGEWTGSADSCQHSAHPVHSPGLFSKTGKRMEVSIIGGGICGLSLALNLRQRGINCRVYERAPEIKPLGVGITLLPHAMREFTACLLYTSDAADE